MTKICTKCKIEKDISEFHKLTTGKGGINPRCKSCIKQMKHDYNLKLSPILKQKIKERKQKWRKNNPDKVKQHAEKSYNKNKEKILKRNKQYAEQHRQQLMNKAATYKKIRRKNDIDYKMREVLSCRLRDALRAQNIRKCNKTSYWIGCSIQELKCHLESKFQDGMTWENHGIHGWHIDHIIPCSKFDLSDPEEQKKCFHYTNLQPLWAVDNLKKGNKYDGSAT